MFVTFQDYENHLVHYIDDGPFFENLLQLIEHYSRYCDGLSTKLKASISTGIKVFSLILLYSCKQGDILQKSQAVSTHGHLLHA